MGHLVIREARPEDKQSLRQVLVNSYQQYANVMPPERWMEYRENIVRSIDREGVEVILIALVDDEIVGTVQVFLSSDAAYGRPELEIHSPIIRLLAVLPSARGRGVATELIRESARRAIALGGRTLYLHTSDMMASAVRLYESLGFSRAYEKDMLNGTTLVKSYCLDLRTSPLMNGGGVDQLPISESAATPDSV